jgi:methyl-accepting chemotaxis protein
MSGAAARDIDTTIGGSVRQVEDLIQTSQGRIMTSFEGSAKAVDDCVTIAEEGKRVLDQVLENSVRAHSAMQEITVASNEQAKAIEEISKAIHQIESATRTNSGLSHESAGVAHEIENQAHLLHDATNELNEMVRGKSSKDVPFHEHFQTPGSGPESGSEFERTAA